MAINPQDYLQVHTYRFNGLVVCTGDVICTNDGVPDRLLGQFWRLFGRLSPGEVDHCAVYIGPGGRCVESGPNGVVVYEMPGAEWDSHPLVGQRGFYDTLVGVAYPLQVRSLEVEVEEKLRLAVAAFCLEQARLHRPYNLNLFDPDTDGAFYCSQLVYKAYQAQGINLNTNQEMPAGQLLDRVVFPQEIWNACPHRRPDRAAVPPQAPER